jgi:hypothetical protein
MTRRILTGYVALILSITWLFTCQRTSQPQDKPLTSQLQDKPSRENFFREVLYAKATKITPLFDDYTEGSYHVDKIDVYKGFPELAQKEGVKLHGLIVIGPLAGLWTYYVFAFVEEKEEIRVNQLTMPHARITRKSTGVIGLNEYRELMSGLKKTQVLKPELPAKGECETCPYPEWHYEVLVADWSGEKTETLYGKIGHRASEANANLILEAVNTLLSRLDKTYPVEAIKRNR